MKSVQIMTILKFSKDDLSYQLCKDAHAGLSHTPDKRAEQEIGQYMAHMAEVEETFTPFATPTNEASLKYDLERYRVGYLKHLNARLGAMSRIYSTFIAGPSNFPARQMEKRNNTLDKRSKELLEFRDKALKRLHKNYNPAVLARAPIRSDEADAIEQYQTKIVASQNDQDFMKAANRIVNSKKLSIDNKIAKLSELGVSEETARKFSEEPNGHGGYGFASYELKNNNANIKRMRATVATLQAEAERPEVEDRKAHILGTPVTIIENSVITRVQLVFNGKPPDEVRNVLKNHGFNWSPTTGCWQRLLNNNARQAIETIIDKERTNDPR